MASPAFLAKPKSRIWFGTSRSFRLSKQESDTAAYEIRDCEDGTLDEVFAYPQSVHVEKMDRDHWWIGITLGSGDTIHVNFTSKKAIKATAESDFAIRKENAARLTGKVQSTEPAFEVRRRVNS